MASHPITSWQIDGGKVDTVSDFLFLGSKITVNGDCSHKIKRQLLLRRKAMTYLNRILKSRDITLLTKVHLPKAMVFPAVMYACQSWSPQKKSYDIPKENIKRQRHHFADKGSSTQSYGFSSSHVWMLELDHKEG